MTLFFIFLFMLTLIRALVMTFKLGPYNTSGLRCDEKNEPHSWESDGNKLRCLKCKVYFSDLMNQR